MKYFIYDKKDTTLACLCVLIESGEIKSTKITKHTFDALTKSNVEKIWPWVNSSGEHIFLYKGDIMPENFNFRFLLDEALSPELPESLKTTKEDILKLPEHMINTSISFIMLNAASFFSENPELMTDFDAFILFKERNGLDNYLFEDFISEFESLLPEIS